MALLDMQQISLAFGGPSILDQANLAIERGERVCLLGRNGTGKSTMLRVLDGTITPDSGLVVRQTGLSVARLDQAVPDYIDGTIFDVVADGLGDAGLLLTQYQHASHRVATEGGTAAMRELDRMHRALDAAGTWAYHSRVETALDRLGLPQETPFALASGGQKRQALLARALVSEPDILLLDEPTNHLDVNAIEWIEHFVIDHGVTLVFVTHDRAFLRRIATRIVELDRGKLVDWGSSYDMYLERKDAALTAEANQWAEFDKKLAKEEVWIRTGVQARRTRNEGRVRALETLRAERKARREHTGTAKFQTQEADRSGHLVFEARHVTYTLENNGTDPSPLVFGHIPSRQDMGPIVRDFSTIITRGDRVGIIGPNGSGKTTLIRILLGELIPQSGTIRRGTGIELAYFDQLREQLDPEQSVFDSIAGGADFVEIGGQRRHVHGYLQNFLFSPDRARTPVRALSGGERNRLLLARLFIRSFNVLVLDEPTNDLDMETLDLLEELLLEFSGTLLLVSHDREFLDNVVTSTLVMEGDGRVGEYAGGYNDWLRQRPIPPVAQKPAPSTSAKPVERPEATRPAKKRKLTFREQHELAELPDRIDELERERDQVYADLASPEFLRNGPAVASAKSRLEAIETEIAALTERWEALETIAAEA